MSKIKSFFFFETMGYSLILISGILPFLHSFVEYKKLDEKLFGYTSIHTFLYSFGVHLSILFLTVGILLCISATSNSDKFKTIQKQIKYVLLSPFISSMFYLTWVFIPDVDYNFLAYLFMTLFICLLSIWISYKIYKHIKYANQGLDFNLY